MKKNTTTSAIKISYRDKMKMLKQEILLTTMAIKKICPTIYEHLYETPLRLERNESLNLNDFDQYLNALKLHLKNAKNSAEKYKLKQIV